MEKLSLQVALEPGARPPAYATPGSVGLDLHAYCERSITLPPGGWTRVSTGVRIAVPPGYEGQVRARSGLAERYGIGLVNAPGTVDSDYRGVIEVILINWGSRPFEIRSGDRVAQLVITPVTHPEVVVVEQLSETERGAGGFGHTGVEAL